MIELLLFFMILYGKFIVIWIKFLLRLLFLFVKCFRKVFKRLLIYCLRKVFIFLILLRKFWIIWFVLIWVIMYLCYWKDLYWCWIVFCRSFFGYNWKIFWIFLLEKCKLLVEMLLKRFFMLLYSYVF